MTKQLFRAEMAQAEKVELLNPLLLKGTNSLQEALAFMVSQADATHEAIGSAIGKPRETVTRFINDNGGLNPSSIERLINECGNLFPLQYLANKYGFNLVKLDEKELKIRQLETQLEQARAAA
jgi:hypothetical protein